jgi:hypothetical protein
MFLRLSSILITLALVSCSRTPPGEVKFKLDREQFISLGVFDVKGKLVSQPLTMKRLGPGVQTVDCTEGTPPGRWSWRAVAYDPTSPELLAVLGGGVSDPSRGDELGAIAGGDAGPPCAVAADDRSVFLGWRAAVMGHEIVAVDPNGRVLWAHHHGPAKSGVRGLAAADGSVFVLGSGESGESAGTFIYKLDARTGAELPWEGREGRDIVLTSLWGADADPKPSKGEAIAARNGRIYVTFTSEQFIAALDGSTGNYVITLTGPTPGQMALSTTPMTDPQNPGQMKIIDFGVCALAGNGLAYFVMEHDPAWVMASTTRWLQEDERIAALALSGDTMKTGNATIYTALADPHHQVQLRSVDNAETFDKAVGKPGGRPVTGPWEDDGLRDIRALAIDAAGQLWVAEGDEQFGRFSVWRTDGKQGTLVREFYGPLASEPSPDVHDALAVTTGDLQWRIDTTSNHVELLARLEKPVEPRPLPAELRDDGGLLLWTPNLETSDSRLPPGTWRVWRGVDSRVYAGCTTSSGTRVYALPALERARMIGSGSVTISEK